MYVWGRVSNPFFNLNARDLEHEPTSDVGFACRHALREGGVPVLMLFLLVQQLRWLLYRCSESVAAAVIMADGRIAHARDERFYQFRRGKRQWVLRKLAE